jgi:hypothetical protein
MAFSLLCGNQTLSVTLVMVSFFNQRGEKLLCRKWNLESGWGNLGLLLKVWFLHRVSFMTEITVVVWGHLTHISHNNIIFIKEVFQSLAFEEVICVTECMPYSPGARL